MSATVRFARALPLASMFICGAATTNCARADQVQIQSRSATAFGQTASGLALSAMLTQQSVRAGAPIRVTFEVKNVGRPLSIFRLGSIREYYLTGTGPVGSPIKKFDRPIPFSGSVRSGWYLATGATYEHVTADLERVYDFRAAGRYVFSFETPIRLEFKLDKIYTILTSNTITLDVSGASGSPPPVASPSGSSAPAHSPPIRPVPSRSISDAQVDSHIPRITNASDHKIVKAVMSTLPPRLRQYVTWFHVPARKGPDYDSLPDHGLVVIFDNPPTAEGRQDRESDLPGLYVLYYDGRVRPDSNVIYDARLDSYLTPVPTSLKEFVK